MEWTVGMTEQHAARCSTTSASPSRSASSRPPVVTMMSTAFSTELILGFYGTVEPHRAREQGDRSEDQAAYDVGLPVHVEVEAVEGHDDDDHDGHRHCKRTGERRRRQAAHDECKQSVDDHGPHHVPARKAVSTEASAQQLAEARAVCLRDRSRRARLVQVVFVEELERFRGKENDDDKGV